MSTDAVARYPRWQGQLSSAPRVWTIMLHEARRAYNDQWGRSALILAAGLGLIQIAQVSFAANNTPSVHSLTAYLQLLGLLKWAALGVAAVMASGALLDDDRKGALELYLSRSVTRWSYLSGKVLAVLALTFLTMFVPALVYYVGAYVLVDTQPEGWAWAILGALGFSAIWAVVASGLGLGISCLLRSSRSVALVLFGGVFGIQILLGDGLNVFGVQTSSILEAITRGDTAKLFSPTSLLNSQREWLFALEPAYSWSWTWGAIGLAFLAAVGWALVWIRHPRIRGVA